MEVTLKSGRKLGAGHKPYIVAECGSNFRDFDDCKNSIAMAKAVGADAVKFQAYDELALYGMRLLTDATNPRATTLSTEELEARGSLRKTLPGQLPLEWLPKLKEKADACGIDFMCTAFSPELIGVVDSHVQIHKVASAELTHKRMLQKLKSIGKPVILSTGASGAWDIEKALEILGNTPVILMYCVAAYPARYVNLGTIELLSDRYQRLVGYSDHTTDVGVIPPMAVTAGACVLEKHFTVIPEVPTPDRDHSLNVDEFKLMVKAIREGLPASIGPTLGEQAMVSRHNRRIIATRDIALGEELREGVNVGIFRSLKDDQRAAHPFLIDEMVGRKATREIQAGEGIAPRDAG